MTTISSSRRDRVLVSRCTRRLQCDRLVFLSVLRKEMMRSGKDAEHAAPAAEAGAEEEAKKQRATAGGRQGTLQRQPTAAAASAAVAAGLVLTLQHANSKTTKLALDEKDSLGIYPKLCATLDQDLNPAEPIILPAFADEAAAERIKAWLEHGWHGLQEGQAMGAEQEAAWLAAFLASVVGIATLLCATLQLASYMGIDGLVSALAPALADQCSSVEATHAYLGEAAAMDGDEELLSRIEALAGKNITAVPKHCAFVLDAQSGAGASLDEDLVSVVATLIEFTPEQAQEALDKAHNATGNTDDATTGRGVVDVALAAMYAALDRGDKPSLEEGYKPGYHNPELDSDEEPYEDQSDGPQSLLNAAEEGDGARCREVLAGPISLDPDDAAEQYECCPAPAARRGLCRCRGCARRLRSN